MSNTPETNNLARGNHVVPTTFAEQLERERDEAREVLDVEIKHHRETTVKWNLCHMALTKVQCDLNKALREQDLIQQKTIAAFSNNHSFMDDLWDRLAELVEANHSLAVMLEDERKLNEQLSTSTSFETGN